MLTDLRRGPPEGCPSDLVLDEWQAGELDSAEQARIDTHVASCPRCTTVIAARGAEADAFLARSPRLVPRPDDPSKVPGPAPAPTPARVIDLRRRWVVVSSGVTALAAAAAALLLLRPVDDDPGATRIKGSARLGFFVKRGEAVTPGTDGERVRPGDQLRFTVSTNEPRHVAVLSLDASGVASAYYPAEAASLTMGPGRDLPLDTSIELDATLGEERLFGVFCEAAIRIDQVTAGLSRDGKVVPSQGCTVDVLRIVKEKAE